MRALPLLLLAWVLPGCNLLDLTPTSEVVRERIAGVSAEPAEIGLGETTTLESLLVRPEGLDPVLTGQVWFACLEAGGEATGCLGLDVQEALASGEGGPPDLEGGDFQFGIGERFDYTAEGDLIEQAWAELEPSERVEGLTVLVAVTWVAASNAELSDLLLALGTAYAQGDDAAIEALGAQFGDLLAAEGNETAARRVVISDKSAGAPGPVPCPVDGLAPNRNPEITEILLHRDEDGADSGFPLGPITFVAPGETLRLRPRLGDSSQEDYLFIDRDDVTECRREQPFFAWLASGGAELGDDYSFTAEEGDLDEVEGRAKVNSLQLPEDEVFPSDGLSLWVVVRDRRGGLTWTERRFLPLR